ncbi:Cell wall integrity and stress response component 1 [Neolecta irregularis DAH-3]|uniref:Cell wall integrity and stress response component 1 n=1 Tax=Neolecta irregularis (strain DAH-3) TaxID=1198029 RepID=A0A1U7LH48_NEOID|nr:Cell wall integrity and stress response component 1 [Neolecta irregularis DAH-3]|eukprot:OLL21851.1 Cell wall integrity and stress response component 1 [Neolecta irregularis DAH-3]
MVFWRAILCPINIMLWRMSVASAQTLQGCYKDDGSLKLANTYIYQSSGYCLKKCTDLNSPVMGTEGGSSCFCGNTIPAEKVDDSLCSTSCTGYPQESCGGDGYLSVYLTGTGGKYSTATSSTKNSSTVETAGDPVSSAVVVGDHTIIIVATPGAQKPETSNTSSSSSSGRNSSNLSSSQPQKGSSLSPAAAAGTAIGLILVLVAIGALVLFIRMRSRKEDYIRQDRTPSTSSMMALSRSSPNASGKDSSVDQRLEPVMMQRRVSEGSLADEQDYSRKILRVCVP